jgi:hypothetical protein
MKVLDFYRRAFGITATVTLLAGCGGSQLPNPGAVAAGAASYSHHRTFRFNGRKQTFKVPAKVTQISIVAHAGNGGGNVPSYGGRVTAVIPVTPSETLAIYVGGNGDGSKGGFDGGGAGGSGGFGDSYGSGGGGASDVREGGDKLADRVLVAGGGGGQGGFNEKNYGIGGKGGGKTGGDGSVGYGDYSDSSEGYDGNGGTGGTQSQGGSGGTGGTGFFCYGLTGDNGLLGKGGAGANGGSYPCGGFGGGGGGGYYGGGGGGEGSNYGSSPIGGGGGGGGGSSYVEPTATDVHMWQGWNKAQYGLVVFSW